MAKKFISGEQFAPTAFQFNRYEEAADRVLGLNTTTPNSATSSSAKGIVVYAQNNTGADIDAGSVFEISGFLWGTTTEEADIYAQLNSPGVVTATADDNTLDKWVVSAGPLGDGGLGKFFVGGVFMARFNKANGDWKYLKTETGSDVLVTCPTPYNATGIILAQSGEWALVQKKAFKPFELFAVDVSKTSGSAGDSTTQCSFVYSATDKENSATLGTSLSPDFSYRTAKGAFVAATKGVGLYNASGTFVLHSCSEVPDVETC